MGTALYVSLKKIGTAYWQVVHLVLLLIMLQWYWESCHNNVRRQKCYRSGSDSELWITALRPAGGKMSNTSPIHNLIHIGKDQQCNTGDFLFKIVWKGTRLSKGADLGMDMCEFGPRIAVAQRWGSQHTKRKEKSQCLSPTHEKDRTLWVGRRKKQAHWDRYSAVLNMQLLKWSCFCATQTGHVGRSRRSYFCWYSIPTVPFRPSFSCSFLYLFAYWLFSLYSVLVIVCCLISSPTN